MKAEVSIIIPTYNRVLDLENSIKAVSNQTFKNWEALIVDDCSVDSTSTLVNIWQVKDNRFKYLKTIKNSGTPVAPRNLGVIEAESDYIAFLDSDDSWEPTKLERQVKLMNSRNFLMSYHNMKVNKNGEYFTDWSKMSTCHEGMVFKQLLRKNFIPTSSVMIYKKTYINFGMMDSSLKISHDWDLWLKITENNPIGYLKDRLGTLSLHSGSVITECHRRRVESRKVIRKWKKSCDPSYYNRIMTYYYVMELFDMMPNKIQNYFRKMIQKG